MPGFFAADGNAADTGATSGRRFRVHFAPDAPGTWRFTAFFRSGPGVAHFRQPDRRRAAPARRRDGLVRGGAQRQAAAATTGRRACCDYVGERYLRFAGTGEVFLKGGADSPENFLAYADFDGSAGAPPLRRRTRADFRPGDPTWRGGHGQGHHRRAELPRLPGHELASTS